MHPRHALGDPFKWLGTLVDCGLTMQPLVENILTKCRPKTKALLRLNVPTQRGIIAESLQDAYLEQM